MEKSRDLCLSKSTGTKKGYPLAAVSKERPSEGLVVGGSPFTWKMRLFGCLLVNHPDGFGRAFFSTYAASLAVIVVDFHRDGPLDDPFGAIHPAKKAG